MNDGSVLYTYCNFDYTEGNPTVTDSFEIDSRSEQIRKEQWWNRFSDDEMITEDIHLRIFFRSCTPAGAHEQRTRLLKMLKATEDRGIVGGYDIQLLGGELCLCTTCQETQLARKLLETVTELAGWHDGPMTSTGFREREIDSSLTDDQYRTIVPPAVSLGVYIDGSLSGVFPCASAGTHYGVEAFLGALLAESEHHEAKQTERQFQ